MSDHWLEEVGVGGWGGGGEPGAVAGKLELEAGRSQTA